MAGIGEAFLTVQAPRDNLSQSALGLTQIFATQRENRLEREDREKVRKSKEIKDWQDTNKLNFNDFQQKVSGFTTFDDVGRDFTQQSVDKYIEYNNLAEAALKKGDFATQRLYENRMLKLKGASGQVKSLVENLAEKHKAYQELVDKGQMSGVDYDTWEAENYAINAKKFALTFDDNDNPVVQGVKQLSDGSSEPFTIPYEKMMNGDWRPYQKTDLLGNKGIVTSVLGSLGSYEKQENVGLKTITKKLWTDELQKGAEAKLLPLVQSDEVMADLTNQFDPTSKKRAGFTDDEKTKMVKTLAEMVRTGYKETYKEEFDKDQAAHQRGLSALAETKRHNRESEKNAAFSNQTSRINANAYVKKLLTETEKLKGSDFSVEVSDPFKAKLPNGKSYDFNTYSLGDNKKGLVQPFVIGSKMGADKVTPVLATTPYVDISSDSNIMKFTDSNGTPHVITRDGRFAGVFRSIENQMKNRGNKATPYEKSTRTTTTEAPPNTSNVTLEDIKNEYGISY